MKIHKEGKKIIPLTLLLLFCLSVISYILLKNYLIFYIIIFVIIALIFIIVWFFREPKINILDDENKILSVADGEVVAIEKTFEREYFNEEKIQISVFMSVFNVHINWIPVKGKIVYQNHKKGRFLPAFIGKSSEENERSTTVIQMKDGNEILIRQIAGIMARRVITYKHINDHVLQNQQLGFIRFGSRVDLFLPKNIIINVKLHQKAYGGRTIIATLNRPNDIE